MCRIRICPQLSIRPRYSYIPHFARSFGIPILEGMACGVPVITSNTSSMPEVAGEDAALIVDPTRPLEITEAMRRLVEDNMLAKLLSEKGIERAKEFSWDTYGQKCAQIVQGRIC